MCNKHHESAQQSGAKQLRITDSRTLKIKDGRAGQVAGARRNNLRNSASFADAKKLTSSIAEAWVNFLKPIPSPTLKTQNSPGAPLAVGGFGGKGNDSPPKAAERGPLDIYRTTDHLKRSVPLEPVKSGNDLRRVRDKRHRKSLETVLRHSADPKGGEEHTECPSPLPFSVGVCDTETGEVREGLIGTTIDCKTWSCPYCGPRKQRRYVAHFTKYFSAQKHVVALTLTLDPKVGISAEESRDYLLWCWSKFRKRINYDVKKMDGRFEFVRCIEFQKNGFAHLHVLCTLPLCRDTIRQRWFQAGGGISIYVDKVAGGSETALKIGYIMKYALKDAITDPKPGRRYVDSSNGCGYHSKAAKRDRLHYVETVTNQGQKDELCIAVWQPGWEVKGGAKNPDTIDTVKALRFENISLQLRSTSYHYKEGDQWFKVTKKGGHFVTEQCNGPPHIKDKKRRFSRGKDRAGISKNSNGATQKFDGASVRPGHVDSR